jgi:hypothetical protein
MKKINKYVTEELHLEVIGYTWQGFKAEMLYPLYNPSCVPKNMLQAKAIAGDFQSLISAKVIGNKKEIVETITQTKLK